MKIVSGMTAGRLNYERLGVNMIIRKKRIFFIATFLIIAAVAVVLCVGFIIGDREKEYEGTLVESGYSINI